MHPNPGQFERKDIAKRKDYNKVPDKKEEKSDPDYENFKKNYKAPEGRWNGYRAPDGSWHGSPSSESAIKAHYKWSKMNPEQRKKHKEETERRQRIENRKPDKKHKEPPFIKRETKDPHKKDPYKKRGDDDKGFNGGGAQVPRKPKPGPKSPGEYRPIIRKTDEDYARRLDKYRVQAR